ncbi:MAG: T9SS type A sorting domain-containing protein, partial [Bacteroidota bacterium]
NFTGTNEVSLQYFAGFLTAERQEIMHLFQWDESLQKWTMAVESPTIDTVNQVVSAPITQPGTYAFFSVTDIFSFLGYVAPADTFEVKATRFIDANSIVDSAGTMVAEARDSVVLKSGFWALEESNFTAKITGYTPPSAARLASTNHNPLKEVLVESIPVFEEEMPFTEEALSDKLLLFPNPFDGQLQVRYYLSTPGKTSIRLVDMAGKYQQVLLPATPQQVGMHEYAFKVEGLPQGTYLLQLTSEEGGKTLLNTQKIIKQ